MITIDFCYEIVTPESAEHGDTEENGFILPGMWKFPDLDKYERQQWKLGDLGSYISFANDLGINSCDGCDWFHTSEPDINYQRLWSSSFQSV